MPFTRIYSESKHQGPRIIGQDKFDYEQSHQNSINELERLKDYEPSVEKYKLLLEGLDSLESLILDDAPRVVELATDLMLERRGVPVGPIKQYLNKSGKKKKRKPKLEKHKKGGSKEKEYDLRFSKVMKKVLNVYDITKVAQQENYSEAFRRAIEQSFHAKNTAVISSDELYESLYEIIEKTPKNDYFGYTLFQLSLEIDRNLHFEGDRISLKVDQAAAKLGKGIERLEAKVDSVSNSQAFAQALSCELAAIGKKNLVQQSVIIDLILDSNLHSSEERKKIISEQSILSENQKQQVNLMIDLLQNMSDLNGEQALQRQKEERKEQLTAKLSSIQFAINTGSLLESYGHHFNKPLATDSGVLLKAFLQPMAAYFQTQQMTAGTVPGLPEAAFCLASLDSLQTLYLHYNKSSSLVNPMMIYLSENFSIIYQCLQQHSKQIEVVDKKIDHVINLVIDQYRHINTRFDAIEDRLVHQHLLMANIDSKVAATVELSNLYKTVTRKVFSGGYSAEQLRNEGITLPILLNWAIDKSKDEAYTGAEKKPDSINTLDEYYAPNILSIDYLRQLQRNFFLCNQNAYICQIIARRLALENTIPEAQQHDVNFITLHSDKAPNLTLWTTAMHLVTHALTHYPCQELGGNPKQMHVDLKLAIAVGECGIKVKKSIRRSGIVRLLVSDYLTVAQGFVSECNKSLATAYDTVEFRNVPHVHEQEHSLKEWLRLSQGINMRLANSSFDLRRPDANIVSFLDHISHRAFDNTFKHKGYGDYQYGPVTKRNTDGKTYTEHVVSGIKYKTNERVRVNSHGSYNEYFWYFLADCMGVGRIMHRQATSYQKGPVRELESSMYYDFYDTYKPVELGVVRTEDNTDERRQIPIHLAPDTITQLDRRRPRVIADIRTLMQTLRATSLKRNEHLDTAALQKRFQYVTAILMLVEKTAYKESAFTHLLHALTQHDGLLQLQFTVAKQHCNRGDSDDQKEMFAQQACARLCSHFPMLFNLTEKSVAFDQLISADRTSVLWVTQSPSSAPGNAIVSKGSFYNCGSRQALKLDPQISFALNDQVDIVLRSLDPKPNLLWATRFDRSVASYNIMESSASPLEETGFFEPRKWLRDVPEDVIDNFAGRHHNQLYWWDNSASDQVKRLRCGQRKPSTTLFTTLPDFDVTLSSNHELVGVSPSADIFYFKVTNEASAALVAYQANKTESGTQFQKIYQLNNALKSTDDILTFNTIDLTFVIRSKSSLAFASIQEKHGQYSICYEQTLTSLVYKNAILASLDTLAAESMDPSYVTSSELLANHIILHTRHLLASGLLNDTTQSSKQSTSEDSSHGWMSFPLFLMGLTWRQQARQGRPTPPNPGDHKRWTKPVLPPSSTSFFQSRLKRLPSQTITKPHVSFWSMGMQRALPTLTKCIRFCCKRY